MQRSETNSDPAFIERDSTCQVSRHSFAGNGKKAIAATECRLLSSSARSRDTKNHLRATVQLDILLGAEQDAGSLRHSGILLPRHIVCQQHAGNRRGGDGDVAVSGYDGPRRGDTVSCGSCPGFGARALRRAASPAAAIGTACARAR